MQIEFVEQILFGSRVYSPGERAAFEDPTARLLVARGVAIETPEPPADAVREAFDTRPSQSRRATKRS